MMQRLKVHTLILLVMLAVGGGIPAAAAPPDPLLLTLTEVNSRSFPQVMVSLAAFTAEGPLEGLTTTNFQLYEDTPAQPLTPLTVEPVTLKELRVVLAFDLSMPPAALDQVKTAAAALVDTFGPEDRAALISFDDAVNVVYNFTNNTTELKTALSHLTPQGSKTALHQAIAQAATMLDALPSGRKAIIVFTDSRDNVGGITMDEITAYAQKARLPLCIIGLGKKVEAGNSSLLADLALTGGGYFTLAQADQAQSTALAAIQRLRQGYQITFTSNLRADNTEHNVYILAAGPPGQGQAVGQFITLPGPVNVTLRGLAAQQTVSGVVDLTPDVIAPAALAAVSYTLDENLLAQLSAAPYHFAWDTSAVTPGAHTLQVKAIDRAGNQGQTQLGVQVVSPLHVAVALPKASLEIGQPVNLAVNIQAVNELHKVELLVDDNITESRINPPYDFSLNSRDYLPGAYRLKVRVTDRLGAVAEDEVQLKLLPEPPPPPGLWDSLAQNTRVRLGGMSLVSLGAIAAVLSLAVVLLRSINVAHQRRAQRWGRVELANQGNVSSRYGLRASDAGNNLEFEFKLGNKPLPELVTSPPETAPTPVKPETTLKSTPAPRAVAPREDKGLGQQPLQQAQAAQSQAWGCLGVVTGIMDTLGQLLPGAAGAKMQGATGQIRGQQMAVERVTRTQEQQVRSVQYLRGQVAGVVPSTGSSPVAPPAPGYTEPAGMVAAPLSEPSGLVGGATTTKRPVTAVYDQTDGWAQTPVVEAGKSLLVDFLIKPRSPYQRQTYTFTLTSYPLDYAAAPAINEHGVVEVKGVFWLWRIVPSLSVVVITLLLLGLIAGLALWGVAQMNGWPLI